MDIPSSLPAPRPAPLPAGPVIAAWLGSTSAFLSVALMLVHHLG